VLHAIATLLYRIDRLLPRARVGGRESPGAYSIWEHGEGGALLERYSNYFGPLDGKDVLDIGCGFGGKTVAYAEAGATVIGVDIEKGNISRCIEFADSRGCRAAFVTGDAQSLPFGDCSFDLVVANDSMEHFARPEDTLPELARVLRPGGSIFLFFTPWRSPLGSHLYDYIRIPWCNLLYSERLIEELLVVVLEKRGIEDPRREAARLMGEYHSELNRITIARFHRIVDSVPALETQYEDLSPPKYSILAPLTRIPLIREYFTGTVVSFLRKKE
jgi:ubiquinone/menaquinone biosynthesis C-methylase UbiE